MICSKFDVKIFNDSEFNDSDNNESKSNRCYAAWEGKRYYAAWEGSRYYANFLRVVLNTDEGYDEYISKYNSLETVVNEAERHMLDSKFGVATIYDGKYRVAVVTKHYGEDFADSHYTKYGAKCSKYECS